MDPPNVQEAINMLVQCINKKKKSEKHYLNYAEVRGFAVGAFQEIRRSNPEANLIDGIYAVMKRDCPDLYKKLVPKQAPVQAPVQAPQAQPKVNEELLLRKYYRMQIMSTLATKIRHLDDFMVDWKRVNNKTDKEAAIHRKLREETYNEYYDRVSDELEALGGQLTPSEIKYVESIPDLRQKITKLKATGKGKKSCTKCGLPK